MITHAAPAAGAEQAPTTADRPYRAAALLARVLAACLLAVAVASLCWSGLNHDVRYELGGMRDAAAGGGYSAAGTFVHRPLAYRLLLSGLDHLSGGPIVVREGLTRLFVMVLTAALAWWLRTGLGRYLARREATAVAGAVGLALLFPPAWDFLQPEWFAVWLAVAALAAGTAPRRMRWAVPAAVVLAALAVLVKYTTAPTALLAAGALVALDRRRGWWTAVATAIATPAGFLLAIAVEPREWRWFRELPLLNANTPLQDGFHAADLGLLVDRVGVEALMNPVVALLPATVVLLARSAGTRRGRWAWPLATAAGVTGVLAALVAQGQWFQYHLAALPVLGAGLWGLALARRPHRWTVAVTVLLAAATPLVIGHSLAWRTAHAAVVFTVLPLVIAGALAAAFLRTAPAPGYAAGLAVLLALAIPAWPTTPYSFDTQHSTFTTIERTQYRRDLGHWLNGVRGRIGPGTPVVYLSFGDVGYLLGNPTDCRYPTPDFLQRTRYRPDIVGTASYEENLRCLTNPANRYAVLDTAWFPLGKVAPQVARTVRARFDCAAPVAANRRYHLVVCPARP